MFSITGMASGLDTDNMLRQLLQVERLPVTKLQQQQASLRKVDDAWGDITKRLSSLRTAINDLTKASTAFADRWKAASSNDSAATAKVTGTPTPGSTTFTVDQLATAKYASSNTAGAFTSADQTVAAGTFKLFASDGTTELASITTDGTTTLADLAKDLDAVAGVKASVVRAGTDDYRLVLSSEKTGADGNFVIDSTINKLTTADFTETAGKNAKLTVGNLAIERSSNTVTDLIDGVTLNLKDVGTTTVTTSQDVDSAVASVKKLVDEVNATLAKLKDLSGYNAETKKAGPLQGDATARRIVDQLRRGVMDVVTGITGQTTAGSVGITMNKDGGFSVNESKLKAALTDDPAAIDRLFTRSASISGLTDVSYVSSTKATQAGTHEAYVHQAAGVARITGAIVTAFPPPAAEYTIMGKDGKSVTVTISGAASIAEAVAQINEQIAAASDAPTVEATVHADGDKIVLEQTRYGSARGLEITANGTDEWGLVGSAVGQDAIVELYGDGTGNGSGTTVTGTGKSVRVTSGAAEGLVLSVGPDGAASPAGSVTVGQGIAGRLDGILATFEGSQGGVQRARKSIEWRIDLYQDRIESFEHRIEQREVTLRRQFAAMETALAQLQDKGNWMASQLQGLSANTPQR